jgi:hypothetical protein
MLRVNRNPNPIFVFSGAQIEETHAYHSFVFAR